jgi:GT2 family glycosyltransferase
MEVSLVITCWNGRKLLQKNLPKVIEAFKNPKNKIKEVLVVDDGSTDDSVSFLRRSYPKVKVIEHKKNLGGYSVTCNTGVREAKSELVTILNLDVAPSKNFLVPALLHFSDPSVFAVSFNENKFGPGKLVWKSGWLNVEPTKFPSRTTLTGWPNGGSSIFRKSLWQKLGGMDELFLPFYFEDLDLGVRAYKAGYQCLFEPRAVVVHEHQGTINPQTFSQDYLDTIKQRNHLLLTWKNIDDLKLFFSHLFHLTRRFLLHPGYLKIVFAAIGRFFNKGCFRMGVTRRSGKLSTQEVLAINEKIK